MKTDAPDKTDVPGKTDAGSEPSSPLDDGAVKTAATFAKTSTPSVMPHFADDSYGPGVLGPRVLFHASEVVDVPAQRMDVYLRAAQATAPKDAGMSAQEADKAISRTDKAETRNPRPVRVWEVREPQKARTPSPLAPAIVDTRNYLASLGVRSVYELSPGSHRLFVPRGQKSALSPLLGSGAPLNGHIPAGRGDITARQWEEMIREAGHLFGLEPQFIAAIIKVESNFDHLAISPAGAQGAMQIMPGTQARLGLNDPFNVRANIHAGCAFMRELLVKYGSAELALAAYNAGPRAVDKYGGIPPYAETQAYVRKVMAFWQGTVPQTPIAEGRKRVKARPPTASREKTAQGGKRRKGKKPQS